MPILSPRNLGSVDFPPTSPASREGEAMPNEDPHLQNQHPKSIVNSSEYSMPAYTTIECLYQRPCDQQLPEPYPLITFTRPEARRVNPIHLRQQPLPIRGLTLSSVREAATQRAMMPASMEIISDKEYARPSNGMNGMRSKRQTSATLHARMGITFICVTAA